MKKLILTAAICLGAISVSAQGWVYSEELRTDVWTNQDKGMDYVDCSDGTKYDAWNALYCTRKNGIESVVRVGSRSNTSGLYDKVAAATRRSQPRNGSSAKSSSSRSVGTYNYNTSDAHIQWARNRQAQIQAAREEAAYKKRMEDMQKKIADDNRAAAVTAQTNAALQVQTNARIQRDRWHATEGAAQAQQRARQAVVVQGPQFDKMKPQSTGSQQASRLRGANKPRRFMAPQNTNARNTARKPMPAVQRSHTLSPQQRQELRQAILNRREQQRQRKPKIRFKKITGCILRQ